MSLTGCRTRQAYSLGLRKGAGWGKRSDVPIPLLYEYMRNPSKLFLSSFFCSVRMRFDLWNAGVNESRPVCYHLLSVSTFVEHLLLLAL